MGRSDSLNVFGTGFLVVRRTLPPRASVFVSPTEPERRPGGLGPLGAAAPGPLVIEEERQGLSSSRGTLVYLCRVLGPRRERVSHGRREKRQGPRFWQQQGLAAGEAISGLDSTA